VVKGQGLRSRNHIGEKNDYSNKVFQLWSSDS
jgi:hypothetical protein